MSARKNFRFALELAGWNQFLCQEITPPSNEVAEILHGAPGNLPDFKTPGKLKVGDLVLKSVKPEATADTWAYEALAAAISGLQGQYMQVGFLNHLAPDALTTVEKYFIGNAWVKKILPGGFNTKGDGDNLIDEITLSVQFYYPTTSPKFRSLFTGASLVAGGLAAQLGQNI